MTDTDPSARLVGAASPERVAGVLVIVLVAAVVGLTWSGAAGGIIPARAESAGQSVAVSPSPASSAGTTPRVGQADLTAALAMIDRLNTAADELAKEAGSDRPRADLIAASMQQANAAIVLAQDPIDSLSAETSTTELGKALNDASAAIHQELNSALSNSRRNTAVYVGSAKETVKLVGALAPRRAQILSLLDAPPASREP